MAPSAKGWGSLTGNEAVDAACGDEQLIERVRGGDAGAYAALYARHVDSARATAHSHARNPSDVPDLVAEAFANVLDAIQAGNGPTVFFRAYLLTTLRRLAAARRRDDQRQLVVDDLETVLDVEVGKDPAVAAFERDVVARSFRDLPERWQAVLWYTEVDGMAPADVSSILGISANAVAALAVRAREGLKQAYLQNHVSTAAEGCAEYSRQLGAHARGGLTRRRADKVEAHLQGCLRCTEMLLHLGDVGFGMRSVIFPAVAGLALAGKSAAGAAGLGLAAQSSKAGLGGTGLGAVLTASAVGLVLVGSVVAAAVAGTSINQGLPAASGDSATTAAPTRTAEPVTTPASPAPATLAPANAVANPGNLPELLVSGVPPAPDHGAGPTRGDAGTPWASAMPPPSHGSIPAAGATPTPAPGPTPSALATAVPDPTAGPRPTPSGGATTGPTPTPSTSPTAEPTPTTEPSSVPAADAVFSVSGSLLSQDSRVTRMKIDIASTREGLADPRVTFTVPRLWLGQPAGFTPPGGWTCVESSGLLTAGGICTSSVWVGATLSFVVEVPTPSLLEGYPMEISAEASGAADFRAWLSFTSVPR